MPLRNRMTPRGEIIATPERGLYWGNRGVLHDRHGELRRAYGHRAWAICELDYKGRRRQLMAPGKFTELFFLDEATAFAAGHRPCGECRGAAFRRFKALWRKQTGDEVAGAPDIDATLHEQRVDARGRQRTHSAAQANLPDGTFLRTGGISVLLWAERMWQWTPGGYRPLGVNTGGRRVTVLTPPGTVDVLRAGYVPVVHPSAC